MKWGNGDACVHGFDRSIDLSLLKIDMHIRYRMYLKSIIKTIL